MSCANPPPSITGGTVITSGPYPDTSVAVYQCITGYAMSGTAYITCSTGVWSTSPTCSLQDTNQVTVNLNEDRDDFPSWLSYVIITVCGLLALLIIACIFVVCCQLLGCYGKGSLFGEHQPCNSFCCTCCRKRTNSYDPHKRLCRTFPRRYEYDEHGRRYHIDDIGRRCYYEHKNNHTTKVVSYADSDAPESNHTSTPRGTFVTTVNEVIADKRSQPAKELNSWKQHSHPVRTINTSTK
ncbi:uncharacterized protein LOC132752186 [Ruditapes philippinarum]|uniref:uncharacterized protein LOC132752186 n=1 Tax=Ruditapes philippinarum TaxID=129788 RepID=UPI00295C032D|nr:uncharacterized protein LOC132752186 [Ruditapes philippinarum]